MLLDYFLIALSITLILLGLVGCILPVIPGPPLAWLGLLLVKFTSFSSLDWASLTVLAGVTLIVTLLDYLFPAWLAKKMGGSNWGAWGTIIGLLVGVVFWGPLGAVVGPFIGAFIGEKLRKQPENNTKNNPWLSALGSFLGFILGVGLKLITVGVIIYFFIVSL